MQDELNQTPHSSVKFTGATIVREGMNIISLIFIASLTILGCCTSTNKIIMGAISLMFIIAMMIVDGGTTRAVSKK